MHCHFRFCLMIKAGQNDSALPQRYGQSAWNTKIFPARAIISGIIARDIFWEERRRLVVLIASISSWSERRKSRAAQPKIFDRIDNLLI